MTRFRPLFRSVRADGVTCSLLFADDGTWVILLDQERVATGRTSSGGVEAAVDRFKALTTRAEVAAGTEAEAERRKLAS